VYYTARKCFASARTWGPELASLPHKPCLHLQNGIF
jgi:hypothetical protein